MDYFGSIIVAIFVGIFLVLCFRSVCGILEFFLGIILSADFCFYINVTNIDL